MRTISWVVGVAGLLSASAIPAAQALQIFVVDSTSTSTTLDVEPSDTVENVKAKIADKFILADKSILTPDNQFLYFGGTFLDDGLTLSDYGIGKDAILDLIATASLDGLPPINRDWNFGIKDAASTAGSGWTLWNTTTPLDLSTLSDGAITLDVFGFNAGIPGIPANYTAGSGYSFAFLNATGGISGFSPSLFSITGLFANEGSVAISGNQLVLNLNAQSVPGPPMAMLVPVAFHCSRRLRRRMAGARVPQAEPQAPDLPVEGGQPSSMP